MLFNELGSAAAAMVDALLPILAGFARHFLPLASSRRADAVQSRRTAVS
jgi:hypothetical protein